MDKMFDTDKVPVRLRRRELKNGNASLYLDIYYNGRRSYEFLKLYLITETNKAEREQNRHTLQLANAIKAKRIIEIQEKARLASNRSLRRKRSSLSITRRCASKGMALTLMAIGAIGSLA